MPPMTKVQQVNRYLRNSILRGKWEPGDKLPSERDLTEKLKASHQVVREAMIQLANEGLVERKQGSGTYVAPGQKADTIAILARTSVLASPKAFAQRTIVEAIKACAKASGYRSILFVGDGVDDFEYMASVHLMDQPVLKRVAGVISLIRLDELEDRLWAEGVPVVSITPHGRYTVFHDYGAMVNMAVKLLEDHGFHEFGVLQQDYPHDEYHGWINEHLDPVGRRAACVCRVPYMNISYDESCDLAYDRFKEFWRNSPHPRAMFFPDDTLCDIALRAILELRVEVPDQLAIVSQSNAGRRFHFPVPLTCVEFDPAAVVGKAWEVLGRLASGETLSEHSFLVPPRIRLGKSLG